MTTTCLKPATQTSPRFDRITAATTLRHSDRQPRSITARSSSTGAARRFLSVLLTSLSAWAV
jgi:hypothetical protein